ncbi:MAG: hypothetical protein Hyperionvirus6_17 [Hyperionvirus sp.]|uniref:Uncharacterized protein n=1 Tax=Hyperionvirus sp. TaxID=2487770 RepID=A0A3G5A7U7_9VIRU|nr:MAG: hypothetical protein Hyperionvirus6_17 [Hyperionvirus sp.]
MASDSEPDFMRFIFNADRTPNFTAITVERVIALIGRLSKLTFLVSTLSDSELRDLMLEIGSLLPYHRGLTEALLVQRIITGPK